MIRKFHRAEVLIITSVLLMLLSLLPQLTLAAEDLTLITRQTDEQGVASYSISLQILFMMTMLSLLPAILMSVTSFTRIVVVLAILRQALGLMQTPSNQIILGLALFTTDRKSVV